MRYPGRVRDLSKTRSKRGRLGEGRPSRRRDVAYLAWSMFEHGFTLRAIQRAINEQLRAIAYARENTQSDKQPPPTYEEIVAALRARTEGLTYDGPNAQGARLYVRDGRKIVAGLPREFQAGLKGFNAWQRLLLDRLRIQKGRRRPPR